MYIYICICIYIYIYVPGKPKVCRILVISGKTMFFQIMTFFGYTHQKITFFDI